jgi:CBS domain-containing protein
VSWLWRAAAGVSLFLALVFVYLGLLASVWWCVLALACLAGTVIFLVLSEPEEAPGPRPAPAAAPKPAPPQPAGADAPAPAAAPKPAASAPAAAPKPAASAPAAAPQPAVADASPPATNAPRARGAVRGGRRLASESPPPASRGDPAAVDQVMTPNPTALPASAPLTAAARAMRDMDIGDVVVLNDSRPVGIVTDRDIVVRALAKGRDLGSTTLGDICSRELTTVRLGTSRREALNLMAAKAIRRLPVTAANDVVVGIVSVGDLVPYPGAETKLADIHRAIPNR